MPRYRAKYGPSASMGCAGHEDEFQPWPVGCVAYLDLVEACIGERLMQFLSVSKSEAGLRSQHCAVAGEDERRHERDGRFGHAGDLDPVLDGVDAVDVRTPVCQLAGPATPCLCGGITSLEDQS